MSAVIVLTVFVLAVFVGVEVVSKVSSTLHTPLMSGANAIHGIILVGAVAVTAHATSPVLLALGALATLLATVNLVGGFVVTDRMLEMFSGRKKAAAPVPAAGDGPAAGPGPSADAGRSAGAGAGAPAEAGERR